jgi:hypothetical protein|tara:strand:+ start:141 stop:344 length:204 start_codon:yes stop_codon:yes gene_type:complete
MSFWKSLVTFLTPLPSGERAKNDKGQFIADDKSTPHVNEAYVDGKKPVRKRKPRTGYAKGKKVKTKE